MTRFALVFAGSFLLLASAGTVAAAPNETCSRVSTDKNGNAADCDRCETLSCPSGGSTIDLSQCTRSTTWTCYQPPRGGSGSASINVTPGLQVMTPDTGGVVTGGGGRNQFGVVRQGATLNTR